MAKVAAVILAAGKGTRMNEGQASPIPKVMFKINNNPMIRYTLNEVQKSGAEPIVLVVGYKQELVREFLGDEVEYAEQTEQLGTGHAVMMAKELLIGRSEAVLVCYGDMPLVKSETYRKLIEAFKAEDAEIALLSVSLNDPESWAFGRVIRNQSGEVEAIVEQKDCTPAQLKIKESNTGVYVFDAEWLWANINQIESNNAQGEYYLTDLISLAKSQGKKVVAISVGEEYEAIGVNNPGQLKQAEEILAEV